jgi:hypothetical protein
MHVEFRNSRETDAADLTVIRFKSKGHWSYSNEMLESWRPAMQITGDYIRTNLVRNIYSDGMLVGFYAITQGETDYLDHLWLLPQIIGKGVGREAMSHITASAKQRGIRSLRIVSDADAEGFYLKFGAKKISEFFSPIQNRILPVLELTISTTA